jgi:hypothetical protein
MMTLSGGFVLEWVDAIQLALLLFIVYRLRR